MAARQFDCHEADCASFNNLRDIRAHFSRVHCQYTPFQCDICDQQLPTDERLFEHWRAKHQNDGLPLVVKFNPDPKKHEMLERMMHNLVSIDLPQQNSVTSLESLPTTSSNNNSVERYDEHTVKQELLALVCVMPISMESNADYDDEHMVENHSEPKQEDVASEPQSALLHRLLEEEEDCGAVSDQIVSMNKTLQATNNPPQQQMNMAAASSGSLALTQGNVVLENVNHANRNDEFSHDNAAQQDCNDVPSMGQTLQTTYNPAQQQVDDADAPSGSLAITQENERPFEWQSISGCGNRPLRTSSSGAFDNKESTKSTSVRILKITGNKKTQCTPRRARKSQDCGVRFSERTHQNKITGNKHTQSTPRRAHKSQDYRKNACHRIREGDERIVCETCQSTFATKNSFIQHQNAYTSGVVFLCPGKDVYQSRFTCSQRFNVVRHWYNGSCRTLPKDQQHKNAPHFAKPPYATIEIASEETGRTCGTIKRKNGRLNYKQVATAGTNQAADNTDQNLDESDYEESEDDPNVTLFPLPTSISHDQMDYEETCAGREEHRSRHGAKVDTEQMEHGKILTMADRAKLGPQNLEKTVVDFELKGFKVGAPKPSSLPAGSSNVSDAAENRLSRLRRLQP